MSDWTLPPCSTLVVGMTGTGKTTYCIRYLLNVSAACRFVFDDLGQVASRLQVRHVSTEHECNAALASRWVVFNPHRMFPGELKKAFRWFCAWSFEVSRGGGGKKVFFADEIWRFQDRDEIPKELAGLAQMGRAENLELMTATQQPSIVNASITGSSTELVCFRLDESKELRKVAELRADADAVQRLPLGSFIAYNRLSGGRLSGRLF